MSGEKLKNLCPQCSHYATCETPCILLHREISRGPEVKLLKEQHLPRENIIVVWSKKEELRFSDMPILEGREDIVYDIPDPGPDAWPSIDVTRKQTGVFLDRVLNGMSFKDIAAKWEVGSANAASALYSEGQKRFLEIIRRMEAEPPRILATKAQQAGRFSVAQKAFLLARCFDLTAKEVGQVLGISRVAASSYVNRCQNRIKAGLQLFVFEGEELMGRGATMAEQRQQTYRLQEYTKTAAQA